MRPIDRFETQFGHMFHYADDQVIGQSLRLYGQWAIDEIALCAWVMRLEPRVGDVIDLGANVGAHTVAFATLFPDRQVWSFEANPATFRLLCANVLANGLENVNPFNHLVGSATEIRRVVMKADASNLGATSFSLDANEGGTAGLMLQAAVDDIVPASAPIAMVKVDVEGMEFQALQGARATLGRSRPAIYFENGRQENSGPIFELLDDLGYETFWHVNHPFDSVNFRGETRNMFGQSVEIGTLAIHSASATIGRIRAALTSTKAELDSAAWAQCLTLNAVCRSELRSMLKDGQQLAALRSFLLPQVNARSGPGAPPALPAALVLPAFADVRRAMLLDGTVDALRAALRPYLEAMPLDEAAYLLRYPDVAAAIVAGQVVSAKAHYTTAGYFEGRSG